MKVEREVKYELLRPEQLVIEREKCPLIFLPISPLEYHGPHLPLGTDVIISYAVAIDLCKRIKKGVVFPVVSTGTDREKPKWMLKNFGFKETKFRKPYLYLRRKKSGKWCLLLPIRVG